jgi:septal ring factor EnvC (AmiA/AmiB activator)
MKKVALVLIPLVLIGALIVRANPELRSHARFGWKSLQKDVHAQITPETDIERLKADLERLDRHAKKHISAIAEEQVQIEDLKADIVRTQDHLARKGEAVQTLRAAVESGNTFVSFEGKQLSRSAATDKLRRDFAAYESLEKDLQAKQKMLAARESAMESSREQLEAMKDTQRQLKVELCQIEAELKALRVAQTRSRVQLDDSELARIKDGIERVKYRLRVEQKTLDLQNEYTDTPAPKKDVKDDLFERIDKKFAPKVADKQ